MKKIFLLFTTLTFLISGIIFATPKPVSADLGLLGAMVMQHAKDACINNIASVPTIPELYTSGYENSEGEQETSTYIENGGGALEPNSIPPANAFADKFATSDSNSKMVLPIGQFYDAGYCHIFKLHMLYSNGKQGTYRYINGAQKTQFQYPAYPDTLMDAVMEVVNGTTVLECDSTKSRCVKEAYSKTADKKVRVVLESGKSFKSANYKNYDWVIVTAYPI